MIKYFIKGTDFELKGAEYSPSYHTYRYGGPHGYSHTIPFDWVEERVVLEPEPPRYTILHVRTKKGTGKASDHEARQRRGLREWDRWYTSAADSSGKTWEELNDSYEIVGVVYRPEE